MTELEEKGTIIYIKKMVEKTLLDLNHPEMPKEKPKFKQG